MLNLSRLSARPSTVRAAPLRVDILLGDHCCRKLVSGSHQSVTMSVSSAKLSRLRSPIRRSSIARLLRLPRSFLHSLSTVSPAFFPLFLSFLFLFRWKIPRRQARLTRPILRCSLKVTRLVLNRQRRIFIDHRGVNTETRRK